ncbi:hypothetical protein BH11BAC1_BH11BAC1_25280 [soil metagenome]
MKKNIFIRGIFYLWGLILLFASLQSNAQIVCIYCYGQNDSISQNVNNLLLNGGFENTTCAFNSNANTWCPNSASYNCDISNWTCTGGGSNTYSCFYDSNYWYVEEGTHAAYFGNSFCPACITSDTACLVNNGCETTGISPGYPLNDVTFGGAQGISLQQTVNGLTPGATYVLEFWAGGESFGGGFPDLGLFGVDLGFGYTYLRCKPTQAHIGIGTRFIIEFNATSTSHTIMFTNWGHICSSCTELVLDDVRLYTLAELSPIVPPCSGANVTALFTAPNHICPGTCTDFVNLSVNATSFLWQFQGANPSVSTDVSPTNICYNTPGTYGVTLIGSNGILSDTLTLNNYVTVYPYPAPQGISQNGDTLFANPGAVSYQWYHAGNIIPGATDYYYIASEGGDYNVVATDNNNCEVEAAIFDVVAGIQFAAGNLHLTIFPNPVTDKIVIQKFPMSVGIKNGYEISVYNMIGKKMLNVQTESLNQNSELVLDVSGLPAAVYYIQTTTLSGIYNNRFIKQ